MTTSYAQMAKALAQRFASAPVRSVERFAQGLHHFVYDVVCQDGGGLVVRLGAPENAAFFEAGLAWHRSLRPPGAHPGERPARRPSLTKNVIVADGQLSGIVDVDWLCFGDSLSPVGLTSAALLGASHDLDYANDWLEALAPTPAMRRAARFYTALFCLDLISETGHTFNRETPVPADRARLERLHGALRAALA